MIIRKVKVTEYEYQAPINYVAGATEPDIQFQLTDYEIPSGATGRVYVGRSDGTFEYTVATISGNTVTVAPTSSMFSVKGAGAIQVTLYVGNEVVKNFAVPVYVHADLADDSAEAGSDVTGVFRAAEEQALADFAEDAEAKAAEVIESIPADYTALTEEVDELNERIDNIEPGLSEDAKQALLACFENVAWINEDGQDYYDALEAALYPSEYPKIVAIFNPGQNTIYTDDTLDSLKQYLTVTYFETEESTGTVVSSANYTLSGALVVGTTTITVVYNNLTTSFKINNVVDFYNIATWSTSDLMDVNFGNIVTEKYPELVSNTTTVNRAIVTCSHGKKGILQYNNNNPIPFTPPRYPIPIPVGATSAIVTSRGGRPVMSIFRYENNQYTFLEQINNTQWGQATFAINQTGQNLFAMFLNIIGDGSLPSEVIVEYGFD